jgi:hypothetical protein
MSRAPNPGLSASLVERVARALCVHFSGDPDAEFAGHPMWRQFEEDARAVLPVIVALANDIAGRSNDGPKAGPSGS